MLKLTVPGSKSWLHRYLIMACFADTPSTCWGFNPCDDCFAMVGALRTLGHGLEIHDDRVVVFPGRWTSGVIEAGQAGAVARMLTPFAAWLGNSKIILSQTLSRRPFEEGLSAVHRAGGEVSLKGRELIFGRSMGEEDWTVEAKVSTQFASGFYLLAAGTAGTVTLKGDASSPAYLALTREIIQLFQVRTRSDGSSTWFADRPRGGEGRSQIDATGGIALLVALVLAGREGVLLGWNHATTQAEGLLPEELSRCGVDLQITEEGLVVRGGQLRSLQLDATSCPDAIPALAVLALTGQTPSRFMKVDYLRSKESDRLETLLAFAAASGISMSLQNGGTVLVVEPGTPGACRLDPRADHRMAMAANLMSILEPGIVCEDDDCLGKSFPNFLAMLAQIRAP